MSATGYEPRRTVPPDYAALCRELAFLKKRYPFIKCGSIGKSVLGKELFTLEFGSSDNKVLYAAAFHGMEWITTLLLLNFARDLCYAMENHTSIAGIPVYRSLLTHGICLIPCVNPDGVDIMLHGPEAAGCYAPLVQEASGGYTGAWQANARGVDLNHNFNAGWCALKRLENAAGITEPAPTRYGGAAPESEPESFAIASFCRRVCFRHATAFHSQGEEIYYDYGVHTPKASRAMAEKMAELSGYRVSRPEGLASMGGFKDWFIDCLHRPAFTVEVGMGQNPLPAADIESIYPRLQAMLMSMILW